ncbi:MAG: hypothetical protein KDA84_18045, partial [Planctomycetaceae bacterium]|nr:hypothetical protein [Planctomycetaceae bacterium]
RFLDETELTKYAHATGQTLTPRIVEIDSEDLPQTPSEAQEFLDEVLPQSLATLDTAAGGQPEGVVIRSPDRSTISKLRFRDYEPKTKRNKR